MLHVILLILKIIGILLLAILGLLLLIVLIVLLVPIRYRVNAEHGEAIRVDGRVNWLLHLIRARVTHIEGVLHIQVQVLWLTLYDNLKPRKPRERKQRRRDIKKKAGKKSEARNNEVKNGKVKNKIKSEVRHGTPRKELQAGLSEASVKKPDTAVLLETTEKPEIIVKQEIGLNPEIKGQMEAVRKPEEDAVKPEAEVRLEDVVKPEAVVKPESVKKPEVRLQPEIIAQKAVQINGKSVQTDKNDIVSENEKDQSEQDQEEKSNIFQKIIGKVQGLFTKVRAFFSGLKNRIAGFFETAANIKNKVGLVSDFIKDKLNREGFQITYHSLKRMLKHIKPTKLRSRLVFGTGDPCSTGQVLGAMGILYSFYGDNVQIIPDFENKIFEGKHYARGRIRLVTILIIVIKLILDKRFQQLRRNFQILKEAL